MVLAGVKGADADGEQGHGPQQADQKTSPHTLAHFCLLRHLDSMPLTMTARCEDRVETECRFYIRSGAAMPSRSRPWASTRAGEVGQEQAGADAARRCRPAGSGSSRRNR